MNLFKSNIIKLSIETSTEYNLRYINVFKTEIEPTGDNRYSLIINYNLRRNPQAISQDKYYYSTKEACLKDQKKFT